MNEAQHGRLGESRSRSASAGLLATADENLYRRNPFRITGLATDATGRTVRQERQRYGGRFAEPPVSHRLPLPEPPTAETLRAAYDELGSAERRLVAELFWLWDAPDGCGCDPSVHDEHDRAVLAHAAALDRPVDEPDVASWRAAARLWSQLVLDGGLWDHLRYRVRALGDRRLDESTVDGLRASLPRALVGTLVAVLAEGDASLPLADCLDEWPVDRDTADDLRVLAYGRYLDQTVDAMRAVRAALDAGEPARAARTALSDLVRAANALQKALPHRRFRRAAETRDQVAVLLNNCGVALCETDPIGRSDTITKLYDRAAKLAVTADTKQTVAENKAYADMRGAVWGARRRTGVGTNPARIALITGYLGAVWYLMAAVALAPFGMTVFAVIGGCIAGARGITRTTAARAMANLALVAGVTVPVMVATANRLLSPGALSVCGYTATVVLIVAAVMLTPARRP